MVISYIDIQEHIYPFLTIKEIDQFVYINKYIHHYIKTDQCIKKKRLSFLYNGQKTLKCMYYRTYRLSLYSHDIQMMNMNIDIENIHNIYLKFEISNTG